MPRALISYPTCIRESLAVFQLLRDLGFTPEEIFLDVETKKKPGYCRTCMRVQADGKEFLVATGWFKGNGKKLTELWQEAADRWNSTTDEDRSEIVMASNTYTNQANTMEFLRRLKEHGFLPSIVPWSDFIRRGS